MYRGCLLCPLYPLLSHSIFAHCQALVVFRRLVFSEFLRWSFRESKLHFKFINEMETSWSRFVEITDEELIEFVEEQENTNIKRKTAYVLFKNFIQTSNPSLLCSTSLHEFSPQVMNDHPSKFIFAVRKKMAQTMDQQVWEVFFQASRDIRKNKTLSVRLHNFYWRCV